MFLMNEYYEYYKLIKDIVPNIDNENKFNIFCGMIMQ